MEWTDEGPHGWIYALMSGEITVAMLIEILLGGPLMN